MRTVLLAAVLGVAPAMAFAGPSDHASRPFGDFARSDQTVRTVDRAKNAPYALTGEWVQRRVLEYRDVPKGRGQTERVASWTWKSE